MKLEVCVEDVGGIDAAVRGGADRLELCTALAVGGLTPALSLIRAAAAAPVPVHLLARPTAGGFGYAAAEQALIAEDIRTAAEAGLAGVAIGALQPDRRLDAEALARLIAHARALGEARGRPLALTLHRAFDLCPDLPAALETAIDLGFERILTSGGQPKAPDGAAMLRHLHKRAADRVIILAASGINPATLPLVLSTGVTEVHASCRSRRVLASNDDERRFGFVAEEPAATDVDMVAELVAMLRAA